MGIRKIVTDENEILRKKSRTVDEVTDRIRAILDDMVETMREANGVGLAAPQVGILRRMFVVEVEPGEVIYMVNPEMIESEGTQTSQEGCLSVPGYVGNVERPARVVFKALNREGKEFTIEGQELLAVALCHEYDHLDGILYTDKAENIREADPEEDE